MVQKHIARLVNEFRFFFSLSSRLFILPELVRMVLNDQFAMRFLDVFFRSALRKTKGIKCL